jgi:hypothetical protein
MAERARRRRSRESLRGAGFLVRAHRDATKFKCASDRQHIILMSVKIVILDCLSNETDRAILPFVCKQKFSFRRPSVRPFGRLSAEHGPGLLSYPTNITE